MNFNLFVFSNYRYNIIYNYRLNKAAIHFLLRQCKSRRTNCAACHQLTGDSHHIEDTDNQFKNVLRKLTYYRLENIYMPTNRKITLLQWLFVLLTHLATWQWKLSDFLPHCSDLQ